MKFRDLPAVGPVSAKTVAERQAELRARRAREGLAEVRGIYLPPEQHAKLKEMARKMNKEKAK